MCTDFTEGWCGHMSVYDDTDEAYGTGRCCWCGTRFNSYTGGCSHGPYEYDKKCGRCKHKAEVLLSGLCSSCYRRD